MLRTQEEFMLRFRGVPVNKVTRALNRLTSGINWTGCSKGSLALSWAKGDKYTKMDKVTLDAIEEQIKLIEARK